MSQTGRVEDAAVHAGQYLSSLDHDQNSQTLIDLVKYNLVQKQVRNPHALHIGVRSLIWHTITL
ncbi:hypothetical protein L210DRAFT_3646759 [Boletus edulis BED1]|uniref:Uncharacterized protein n=1 Tax=Boletus edulis BED1 TaxID=1328754 RepID=A0AAD4GDI8_BOLED|nr:hypothetical protein L210DRAFT_3651709 [Boletus edulis BED1]KAF8438502.1 hypothetical protein L210DRAFT_3646759 [Boletus edulis BED1]